MMTKDQRYHFLVDSAVDSMSEQLIEDFHLPVPEALNFIYQSSTLKIIQDPRTLLYTESPDYLYLILKYEYQNGKLPETA